MSRKHLAALGAAFVAVAFVAFVAVGASRADDSHEKKGPPSKAQPALDRLKTLEGDWVYAAGENKGHLVVSYKVSSGGTTVVENLFPDTDHNMITIYHLDGDRLMMTHYCSAGNQPRMHADAPAPGAKTIAFTCTGGSNMKEADGHMHAMTLTFVDDDHVSAEWTWKGEQSHSSTFEFERKK